MLAYRSARKVIPVKKSRLRITRWLRTRACTHFQRKTSSSCFQLLPKLGQITHYPQWLNRMLSRELDVTNGKKIVCTHHSLQNDDGDKIECGRGQWGHWTSANFTRDEALYAARMRSSNNSVVLSPSPRIAISECRSARQRAELKFPTSCAYVCVGGVTFRPPRTLLDVWSSKQDAGCLYLRFYYVKWWMDFSEIILAYLLLLLLLLR